MITLTNYTGQAVDFNNYYDFTDGVNVSDRETKRWIIEGLERINEKIKAEPNREDFFSSTMSGNTLVIIETYRQKQDKDKFIVYVKIYK